MGATKKQEEEEEKKPTENVYSNDFVKLMKDSWTKDLHKAYEHNVGFAKYLNVKTNDLTKYVKVKRK